LIQKAGLILVNRIHRAATSALRQQPANYPEFRSGLRKPITRKRKSSALRLESTATAKHLFTIPPVRFGMKFKNEQQNTLQPKS